MDVQFAPRGQGWKHRGRPPREVPPAITEILEKTYETRTQAIIPLNADFEDVDNVISMLRRGAKNMGKHLRLQRTSAALRFFVEDK